MFSPFDEVDMTSTGDFPDVSPLPAALSADSAEEVISSLQPTTPQNCPVVMWLRLGGPRTKPLDDAVPRLLLGSSGVL